jgi:CBS domain-containing protein
MLNVADIMTVDVPTCRDTDSLNRAAQLMWERCCGCLPVLDGAEHVVGIVTDRDVCMAAYTQGKHLADVPVTTAMSRPVQSCLPFASLEEGEEMMMGHGLRRLVVIDAQGHLCGMLSLEDIAKEGADWNAREQIDLERIALILGEIARRNRVGDPDDLGSHPSGTDVSDLVHNSLAALKTLRGEIRNDLGLARDQVRDRWQRVEARLRAAGASSQGARRQGVRRLAALVENARPSWTSRILRAKRMRAFRAITRNVRERAGRREDR